MSGEDKVERAVVGGATYLARWTVTKAALAGLLPSLRAIDTDLNNPKERLDPVRDLVKTMIFDIEAHLAWCLKNASAARPAAVAPASQDSRLTPQESSTPVAPGCEAPKSRAPRDNMDADYNCDNCGSDVAVDDWGMCIQCGASCRIEKRGQVAPGCEAGQAWPFGCDRCGDRFKTDPRKGYEMDPGHIGKDGRYCPGPVASCAPLALPRAESRDAASDIGQRHGCQWCNFEGRGVSDDERAVVDAAVARRLAEVKRERALEACRRGELGAVASHDRLFGAECDAVTRENEAVDAYMGRRFPKQMDPEQMAAVMGRARNKEIQS